ncbi:MAG: hypothetical protein IPH32_15975 [Bacteroidetes bacterium]|nr:hypothetical protein [Bacteroidota bacterium]
MLWCSEHSTYHFLYGQDISDIHYLKDEKTAERRGTIIFHDDKKVILGNLNNFMVYLNYFTSNGFELISYNPSINSTLFTNSSALLRKK